MIVELYKNNWETPQSSAPIFNPYAKGNNLNNNTNNLNNSNNCPPMNHHLNQINQLNECENNNFDPQDCGYDFGPCGDENDEDVCNAFEEFLNGLP